MPVQSFTSFVAEQAVGIAIGAVAAVAARKLGPKLASATPKSSSRRTQTASGKLGAALVTTVPVAVARPVKITGRVLYEQVATSVQRYGEHWKELIAEAQAMQGTSDDD